MKRGWPLVNKIKFRSRRIWIFGYMMAVFAEWVFFIKEFDGNCWKMKEIIKRLLNKIFKNISEMIWKKNHI